MFSLKSLRFSRSYKSGDRRELYLESQPRFLDHVQDSISRRAIRQRVSKDSVNEAACGRGKTVQIGSPGDMNDPFLPRFPDCFRTSPQEWRLAG